MSDKVGGGAGFEQRLARLQDISRRAAQGDVSSEVAAEIQAAETMIRQQGTDQQLQRLRGLDTALQTVADFETPAPAMRRIIGQLSAMFADVEVRSDDVTAFAQQVNLSIGSDAILAKGPGEIDDAIAAARASLGEATSKPVGAQHTASIATNTSFDGLMSEAWQLYGTAKDAIGASSKLNEASAELELSLALLVKMRHLARDSGDAKAENVADNRIGMVLHQLGLASKAEDRNTEHFHFEAQALEAYDAVFQRPDVEPPYCPAPAFNAICSFAQIGNLEASHQATRDMIEACGSAQQLDTMAGVFLGDKELKSLAGVDNLAQTMWATIAGHPQLKGVTAETILDARRDAGGDSPVEDRRGGQRFLALLGQAASA